MAVLETALNFAGESGLSVDILNVTGLDVIEFFTASSLKKYVVEGIRSVIVVE